MFQVIEKSSIWALLVNEENGTWQNRATLGSSEFRQSPIRRISARASMASGADMRVGDLQESVCWWSRKAILKVADSQRADKTTPSLNKL